MRHLAIAAAFVASSVLLAPTTVTAKTVAGVTFAATSRPGTAQVKLIGAGLRSKWMVKVYAMAAYSKSGKRSAQDLINTDEPKFIWIRMLRTIGGNKMRSAIDDGLADNVPSATRKSIAGNIAKLKRAFPDSIKEGLDIGFVYEPGTGTTLRFAHHDAVTLKGKDTMSALWAIWFGKDPADDDLKDGILGKEAVFPSDSRSQAAARSKVAHDQHRHQRTEYRRQRAREAVRAQRAKSLQERGLRGGSNRHRRA